MLITQGVMLSDNDFFKHNLTVRKCIICGSEYMPTGNQQKYCRTCAPVVLKAKRSEAAKRFNKKQKDIHKYWREVYRRNKKIKLQICKLCGNPIELYQRRDRAQQLHDTCVVDDLIKTINSEGKLTSKQHKRLRNLGYKIDDFKADYKDEIKG